MFNYRDYYSYLNNNYNLPNFNQDKINNFQPYKGFIRGNLFIDLYNPYKSETPIQIIPQNEQAKLLTTLNSLEFAMNDLQLYLDVHPSNNEALNIFNEYRHLYNESLYNYQKQYGAITINSESMLKKPYSWINSPWPWEDEK